VGLQFAREVVTASDENHLLDVIGGNAGAVAPLLWLAETHHCDQLHAQAIELTDELVRTATKRDRTWSWEPERASGKDIGRMPLCGLAHGASGMGLALLEMGVHHRRQDWIDGGLAAFAYEDQLYDSNEQNWPDLRTFDSPTNDGEPAQRAFMVAWCHGAAGIALARLRACQLLPERRSELIAGAERAVCATTGRLQRMPTGSDASPCHGRAGLAEALLCAATILDDRQYADEAINRWLPTVRSHQGATDWPCGVPSGRNNPSLMLGQAGIGYGLLRADNPAAVPSVLLITPPQGFD
jgi:lantibiotic modifying enzyme